MLEVGLEPTRIAPTELKPVALNHSAIPASQNNGILNI